MLILIELDASLHLFSRINAPYDCTNTRRPIFVKYYSRVHLIRRIERIPLSRTRKSLISYRKHSTDVQDQNYRDSIELVLRNGLGHRYN